MYKTISVDISTYNQLNAIASRLKKPKAKVVEELVEDYNKKTESEEKKKLQEFNKKMDEIREMIKLPKETKISTDNIDEQFSVLADTDY